mmetsp:Transcript_92064/g.264945  ORF Transcript_92064/g.264945 Transcript_92064/m.264945 type:complete len:353 (-) Transcript_92064:17-1075(-)
MADDHTRGVEPGSLDGAHTQKTPLRHFPCADSLRREGVPDLQPPQLPGPRKLRAIGVAAVHEHGELVAGGGECDDPAATGSPRHTELRPRSSHWRPSPQCHGLPPRGVGHWRPREHLSARRHDGLAYARHAQRGDAGAHVQQDRGVGRSAPKQQRLAQRQEFGALEGGLAAACRECVFAQDLDHGPFHEARRGDGDLPDEQGEPQAVRGRRSDQVGADRQGGRDHAGEVAAEELAQGPPEPRPRVGAAARPGERRLPPSDAGGHFRGAVAARWRKHRPVRQLAAAPPAFRAMVQSSLRGEAAPPRGEGEANAGRRQKKEQAPAQHRAPSPGAGGGWGPWGRPRGTAGTGNPA